MQEYMEEGYSCTLTSSLADIFEYTHTHSPGLEQFPFLSLQPSRQIAKKKKKRGEEFIYNIQLLRFTHQGHRDLCF